jgi:hypothetical protein
MSTVENLESKICTLDNAHQSVVPEPDGVSGSFVSGNLGVTAKFSFRLTSPWAAFRTFLRKVLA